MGNEYNQGNPTEYPAAFAHEVIAVGATDINSLKAGFSNTGPHIDVCAPGVGIYTTVRGGGMPNNPSGTSFSAPIVSGVAGLIISQGLDRSFNLTNDDVRHILEITADDITQYGVGFDEFTGYGKVNAYNALELLDEPNELYNGTSYGGSTTMTNLNQWIYIGDRWGLAAGTYLNVDRYEVTRHIVFDVPFCSVPEVWLRDKECISMNFANPNDGFPWAEITNVTTTGFDVRYSAYYVRNNILGQTINKWVPSSISSTKIVYTAIGEPNIAGTAGPITGPSFVCTSNATFTLHNRPPGTTVNWTKSPYLNYVSGQGTNSYTVKAASSTTSGSGWVQATISGNCGNVIIRDDDFWVGKFENTVVTGEAAVCPDTYYTYTALVPGGHSSSYSYSWTYPGNWMWSYQYQNTIRLKTPIYNPDYGTVRVSITNACGTSGYSGITVYPGYNCGGYYRFSPNPADDYIEISIDESKLVENAIEDYQVKIYNSLKVMVYETGKTREPILHINTRNLKDGVYFIHFITGKQIEVKQLIVNH